MNSQVQRNPRTVVAALEAGSAEFLKQSLEGTPNLGAWTKLYVASQTLLTALQEGQVIAALAEISSNLLGCEHLAIVEIEHPTGTVHFLGGEGLSPERREVLIREEGILESRIMVGRVWISSDHRPDDSALASLGISAVVPFWKDERSSAAILLFELLPQRSGFDAEDREVLQFLSRYAGPCLRSQLRG